MNRSSCSAAGRPAAKKKKMDSKRSKSSNCSTGQAKKSSGAEKKEGTEVLQIIVKRLGVQSDISLDVDPSSTVLDLKKLIAVELEALNGGDGEVIPTSRHRLIYFGRMLRDDNEVLGSPNGVNMKSDVVNYVHFTPLPKGAVPSETETTQQRQPSSSNPSPGSRFGARDPSIDLEARIERARRLGEARRERRRRLRSEPYPVPPPPVAARRIEFPDSATSDHRATAPPVQQQDQQQIPLVALAEQILLPGLQQYAIQPPSEIVVPVIAAAPPPPPPPPPQPQVVMQPQSLPNNLQALLFPSPPPPPPPVAISMPTVEQITQLSATISAASREAEATNSWLNDRFMDHDRRAVADIMPTLTVLFERLRQFEQGGSSSSSAGAARTGRGGGGEPSSYDEANLRETLQLLDHLSRETANLASTLRTSLIARSHLSTALNRNSSLQQILRGLLGDETPPSSRINSSLEQTVARNSSLEQILRGLLGDETPPTATVGPLEQLLRNLLYP